MKVNLKTTIALSTGLAVLLNVAQAAESINKSSRAYFAPSWALASAAKPVSTQTPTGPAPLSITPPAAEAAVAKLPTAPSDPVNPGVPVFALASTTTVAATLQSAGLNATYADLYLEAQQRTGTPWQLLAAVHKIESNQAGNTDRTSYAGATGPMQFMPATFNHYALSATGGAPDITNVADAILTAGNLLAHAGAANGDYSDALYAYNHSQSYVATVLQVADELGL